MEAAILELGYTANEAADMIKKGLNNELAKLKKDGEIAFRRDNREANELGGLNNIEDIVKKLDTDVRDAKALGIDDQIVRNTFNETIGNLFEGMDTDGLTKVLTALNDSSVVLEGVSDGLRKNIIAIAQDRLNDAQATDAYNHSK